MSAIISAVTLIYETLALLIKCAARRCVCVCQVDSGAEVSRHDLEQRTSYVMESSLSMVESCKRPQMESRGVSTGSGLHDKTM